MNSLRSSIADSYLNIAEWFVAIASQSIQKVRLVSQTGEGDRPFARCAHIIRCSGFDGRMLRITTGL